MIGGAIGLLMIMLIGFGFMWRISSMRDKLEAQRTELRDLKIENFSIVSKQNDLIDHLEIQRTELLDLKFELRY